MDKQNSHFARHAALNGEVVTEGHVNYCRDNGHATHTVDGVRSPRCSRCDATVGTARTPQTTQDTYRVTYGDAREGQARTTNYADYSAAVADFQATVHAVDDGYVPHAGFPADIERDDDGVEDLGDGSYGYVWHGQNSDGVDATVSIAVVPADSRAAYDDAVTDLARVVKGRKTAQATTYTVVTRAILAVLWAAHAAGLEVKAGGGGGKTEVSAAVKRALNGLDGSDKYRTMAGLLFAAGVTEADADSGAVTLAHKVQRTKHAGRKGLDHVLEVTNLRGARALKATLLVADAVAAPQGPRPVDAGDAGEGHGDDDADGDGPSDADLAALEAEGAGDDDAPVAEEELQRGGEGKGQGSTGTRAEAALTVGQVAPYRAVADNLARALSAAKRAAAAGIDDIERADILALIDAIHDVLESADAPVKLGV